VHGQSIYGEAKRIAEAVLTKDNTSEINTIILRLPQVYGYDEDVGGMSSTVANWLHNIVHNAIRSTPIYLSEELMKREEADAGTGGDYLYFLDAIDSILLSIAHLDLWTSGFIMKHQAHGKVVAVDVGSTSSVRMVDMLEWVLLETNSASEYVVLPPSVFPDASVPFSFTGPVNIKPATRLIGFKPLVCEFIFHHLN